jgi:hypothetical protein
MQYKLKPYKLQMEIQMNAKISLKSILAGVALAFAGATAHSAVAFSVVAGGGQLGTGNNLIFNNSCVAPVTEGFTLSGCLNGANNGLLVDVIGSERLIANSVGQASIKGFDGSLTDLKIDTLNFTASTIILQIFSEGSGGITFSDAAGASAAFSITPRNNGNSNSYYTLTGGNLDSITLAATGGLFFSEIKQVRFDIDVTSAVPEPQEWAMLLGGLAVVSAIAKRRKNVRT